MTKQRMTTRTIVTLAMLVAVAFVLTAIAKIIPINIAGFLSYDPKDIVIVIAGFIFGPLGAAGVAVVTGFIEMFTISATGIIGCLMNIISSCAFACVASAIYKKKHNLKGAVIGLICGCLAMTGAMLLWNYIMTPIYMGVDRDMVASMLPTVFLPFNLVKSGINAAIAMILYKPIVKGLRRAKLVAPSVTPVGGDGAKRKINIGTIVVGIVIAITLIFFLLAWAGIIG